MVLAPVGFGWLRWDVYIRGEYLGEYPDLKCAMRVVNDAMGEPLRWTTDDTRCHRGWSH